MRAACPTPVSPIDYAFPARCPGRSRLTGVPLGRTPSLHKLRRLLVFVRSLHRYYGSVRLPNTVHTGITDLPSPAVPPTFASGRCWGLSVLVHETSRSPGSRDSARSDCHSPFASQPILPPPWHHKSSTWKPFLSKLNSPACAPLSTLRQPVTRTRRMTRGRGGWLALPRTALSSAVSCRFIPTLSVPPTLRKERAHAVRPYVAVGIPVARYPPHRSVREYITSYGSYLRSNARHTYVQPALHQSVRSLRFSGSVSGA